MSAKENGILIVEDEPSISMMLEDMLTDLGFVVDGCAYREEEALDLLESSMPDLALLDINLGLTTSLAIAAACKNRGIAVVFTTGYATQDVPSECGNAPILSKPFSTADLKTAISLGLSMNRDPGAASRPAGMLTA